MRLYSKRNVVNLMDGYVRKHFDSVEDWRSELEMYRKLSGFAPKLLHAAPSVLITEYLDCPHLLEVLEMQEVKGFAPQPWKALSEWIGAAHARTGMIPGEGNLRNFLWQDGIVGIDFEHWRPGQPAEAVARIAAFLLEYSPRDTVVKRQAAEILTAEWKIPRERIVSEREKLRIRRENRRSERLGAYFSMALLAGGKSSRMGRDKAGLPFFGSTLLEFQKEKAELLGIGDVLISGPGNIEDLLPERGPLGGMHACLERARSPHCVMLSVDAPLVPAAALRLLARRHLEGRVQATIARHGGKTEPLIGVYDAALAEVILPLVRDGGAPVRALLERIDVQYVDIDLPEDIWRNCNTPEEYEAMLRGANG